MLHHVMSCRQEEGSQCCPAMMMTQGKGVIDDTMEVFDMTSDDSHGEDTPQAGPAVVPSVPPPS